MINPYNPEEYLMGIILDGESYRQSQNTKDREVAQVSVLSGLGWELHRIWTMDWWDNREKELAKLMQRLGEKKEEARLMNQQRANDSVEENKEPAEMAKKQTETEEEPTETAKEPTETVREAEMEKATAEGSTEMEETVEEKPVDEVAPVQNTDHAAMGYYAAQNPFPAAAAGKVASCKNEAVESITQMDPAEMEYRAEEYTFADVEMTDLSTADYIKKESLALIADKMQQIIDAEAPIMYDRLVKKTLRAFNIARSSPQTLEATDKALKKVSARMNKQARVKFYWRKDQDPDQYRVYRRDMNSGDKRSADEICQQELKNAVCIALKEKGAQDKESLMKSTIRTMGYARSSTALAAAAEKGLKYGRKTGEIVQDEEKRFLLGD